MLIKLQVSNLEELNIYITIKKIVKLNEFAFLPLCLNDIRKI